VKTVFCYGFGGRLQVWYSNMPHSKIAERKGHQGWMKEEGSYFIFPGGGTMFTEGAHQYIEKLGAVIPLNDGSVRTALDIGCGVCTNFKNMDHADMPSIFSLFPKILKVVVIIPMLLVSFMSSYYTCCLTKCVVN
jgi:hypothetical protein